MGSDYLGDLTKSPGVLNITMCVRMLLKSLEYLDYGPLYSPYGR